MDDGATDAEFILERVRLPDVVESVLNIKRVTYRVVQLGSLSGVEMAHPTAGQQRNRHSHDVVARDHAHLGQPLFGADFDLRSNPPNGSSNRNADDGREDLYGRVSSQDAHWTPTSGTSHIGPENVAPGYQLGIASVASRAATSTIIGS